MVIENIVLIGASSEIANSFKLLLNNKKEYRIFTISSKKQEEFHLEINNYFDDSKIIVSFIKKIQNPTIIFFNGFLNENRPNQYPSIIEILDTIKINFQIPYFLTLLINKDVNYKKIIYISSLAAVKPRYKNYIYGLSKKKLEDLVVKTITKKYLILRFGMIETRMSKNHTKAPFTISSNEAALKLYKKLNETGIRYPSFPIFIFSLIIKVLPIRLLDLVERKFK